MIRLNSDLGEGFGRWSLADEEAIMPYIDMANVACGFHAGDPVTITHTLRLARHHGVEVGAHPGYPDLVGFGRRHIPMDPEELRAALLYQIGALDALAGAEGLELDYVKPHGALYNDMMRDESIFTTILDAIDACDRQLDVMILASSRARRYAQLAQERGIGVRREFFADRAYTPGGDLMPRSKAGAVIHDPQKVLERVREAVGEGCVTSSTGEKIPLGFETICVHGDNPEALELTRSIRSLLEELQ